MSTFISEYIRRRFPTPLWSSVKENCSNLALITCSTTLGLFRITANLWYYRTSYPFIRRPAELIRVFQGYRRSPNHLLCRLELPLSNSDIVIVVLHIRFGLGKRQKPNPIRQRRLACGKFSKIVADFTRLFMICQVGF